MAKFSLDTIRHSAAHVLAQAVLREFPTAKLGIGPSIKNGFYYDFDVDEPFNEAHLEKFESHMKDIFKEQQSFSMTVLSREDAEQKVTNQPLKQELISDLGLSEYSFYQNGPFEDLCKGPHVEHTGQIGVFKLLKVSAAYWKGSEKNQSMQRIYGVAFSNKKELKQYLVQLEEAKKRDHRLIGKQLELFDIHDDVGGGLITWLPDGSRIRNKIEAMWKRVHELSGYEYLHSPHIGKSDLWKKSGHLECYQENMYNSIEVDDVDYFVKPMNCPFHILSYQHKPRSYRDCPIRYAELGTVYRYERSGVLHGLFRVRGFTQDDAHIMCTPEQVNAEIDRVLQLCLDMLRLFGFERFKLYLATKPDEKAVGEDHDWQVSQDALEAAIKRSGIPYEVDLGGGAFYGPKIDIKIEDAIGREWQCSTIQFDFNLPERFDMTYIDRDGEKKRPFMIHRALLGSLERFFGILIEHYEGKFPFWLAPRQCRVLTLSDEHHGIAQGYVKQLIRGGLQAESDISNEKLGYKIRKSILDRVSFILILGKKEIESNQVTLKCLKTNEQWVLTIEDVISRLQNDNKIPIKEEWFDNYSH